MGIIAWIVLGAIAGWVTNMIMGGKEGVIATIILGIIGAVVGGWLAGTVLKVADVTGVNVQSIVVAVIGAVIVVAVYRMVVGRRLRDRETRIFPGVGKRAIVVSKEHRNTEPGNAKTLQCRWNIMRHDPQVLSDDGSLT